MTEEIAKLKVTIQADSEKLKHQLEDISKELRKMSQFTEATSNVVGKQFTGSILKANVVSQVLLGTLSKLGRGFSNAVKSVISLGSQYTRLKTSTETVTKNLGITTDQLESLRLQLEESNTYGSRAEEVIRTLATSGLVKMADSLEVVDARTGDVMKGVGGLVLTMKDLGASAGIDSADAINRLTQFINEGNIAVTRGLMSLGRMNIEYRDYAKSVGKTTAELTAQEMAQVRMNIVIREGEKAFGAYNDTMQTSGKAMGSIRDASISIFERLGNYLEPVFASVTRGVFLFVDGIRQSLIQNAQTFKSWAERVAGYVVAVIRILGRLLTRIPVIGKNFETLRDFALKPTTRAMDGLASSGSSTAEAMDDATGSAKALKKELLGLAGFDEMNVLREQDGGTTGGAGSIGVGGLDIGEILNMDAIDESVDAINGLADVIEQELLDKLRRLREVLEPIWEVLKPIAGWMWDNKGVIIAIGIAIGIVLAGLSILAGIISNIAVVWGAFNGVLGFVAGLFGAGGLLETGILKVMYAFDGLKGVVVALAGAFGGSLGLAGLVLIALIGQILIWIWQLRYAIEKNKEMWEKLKPKIDEVKNAILDNLDPMRRVKEAKEETEKASERLRRAEDDLRRSYNDLIVTAGDLADAELSVMDAHDRVSRATERLTELKAQGKEGTDEYRRAELELESANGRLESSNRRLEESQKKMDKQQRIVGEGIKEVKNSNEDLQGAIRNTQKELDKMDEKNAMRVSNLIKEGFKSMDLGQPWQDWARKVRDALNRVIGLYNKFRAGLNTVKMPDFLGGGSPNLPYIQPLARGGVIESPTVAMIGEAGREVVMPLENNTGWIDELASKLGGQGSIHLTVQVGDEKLAEHIIDYANDKGLRTGNVVFNI